MRLSWSKNIPLTRCDGELWWTRETQPVFQIDHRLYEDNKTSIMQNTNRFIIVFWLQIMT